MSSRPLRMLTFSSSLFPINSSRDWAPRWLERSRNPLLVSHWSRALTLLKVAVWNWFHTSSPSISRWVRWLIICNLKCLNFDILQIPCAVLMGANLANEVAEEKFCETTIGVKDAKMAPILRDLFQTPNFRVVVSDDVDAVEICGALKNIVACGAGFVDGLGLGDNTKAAVIRLGLMEMIKFVDVFYPGSKLATFFESCGVADLITTCYGEWICSRMEKWKLKCCQSQVDVTVSAVKLSWKLERASSILRRKCWTVKSCR